jgi:hypothetical protein
VSSTLGRLPRRNVASWAARSHPEITAEERAGILADCRRADVAFVHSWAARLLDELKEKPAGAVASPAPGNSNSKPSVTDQGNGGKP